MALLKAPTKQKSIAIQVRLEEEVRVTLNKYAQFIEAHPSYVVSEALKMLFKRDQEFKRWLGHPTNTAAQAPNEATQSPTAAPHTCRHRALHPPPPRLTPPPLPCP